MEGLVDALPDKRRGLSQKSRKATRCARPLLVRGVVSDRGQSAASAGWRVELESLCEGFTGVGRQPDELRQELPVKQW
jgi:hypothetical protein